MTVSKKEICPRCGERVMEDKPPRDSRGQKWHKACAIKATE